MPGLQVLLRLLDITIAQNWWLVNVHKVDEDKFDTKQCLGFTSPANSGVLAWLLTPGLGTMTDSKRGGNVALVLS